MDGELTYQAWAMNCENEERMSEFITEWIPDAHLYREPIVRCKDCKHYENHGSFVMCMLPDGDGGYACWIVEPDGFCAWGEKVVS